MAMKASTIISVMCLLVAAMAVAPIAKAQLGIFNGLLGLFRIQGTLFCSANGRINVTSTPFANAVVQLQCGNGSSVVSSGMTNSSGGFSILLDPITMLLSALLNNCKLVATTPLSNCDAALPSTGYLVSELINLGTQVIGLLNIFNIVPRGFNFTQNLNG